MVPYSHDYQLPDMLDTKSVLKKARRFMNHLFKEGYLKIMKKPPTRA